MIRLISKLSVGTYGVAYMLMVLLALSIEGNSHNLTVLQLSWIPAALTGTLWLIRVFIADPVKKPKKDLYDE